MYACFILLCHFCLLDMTLSSFEAYATYQHFSIFFEMFYSRQLLLPALLSYVIYILAECFSLLLLVVFFFRNGHRISNLCLWHQRMTVNYFFCQEWSSNKQLATVSSYPSRACTHMPTGDRSSVSPHAWPKMHLKGVISIYLFLFLSQLVQLDFFQPGIRLFERQV